MDQPIIEVHDISKKYILSHQRLPYETLRDTVTEFAKKPFHMLRGQGRTTKEDFWALKDINFNVQQGEVIGIIGPNGSGKSTLLKIISQITQPTTGEITIRGHVASLLEVGTGFHPELTGRENVFLNGAILGMSKKEISRKFADIVEFSGVEKFLDTPVKRYSSGMYVRLAFSVAAHMDPEILIIDEVLSVGDAEFQRKCLDKMETITKKGGRTILFVSHNLIAVQKLCTKTILLEGGKILHSGGTTEVINKYLSEKSQPSSNPQLQSRVNIDRIHFTNIIISNSKDSGMVQSHDRMKFVMQYTSDYVKPITDVRVVITVKSEFSGQVVLRLDSDVAGKSFPTHLPPQGDIICETGPVNLSAGKYFADIDFITQDTSKDYILRAGEFDVETDLEPYRYKIQPDKSVCDHLVEYSYRQPT